MLCNNISESFNSMILNASGKPIVTMLEEIRTMVMERMDKRMTAMAKDNGTVCPKVKSMLDSNLSRSAGYTHKWNGKHGFQVQASSRQVVVDILKGECSCGE